VTLDHQILLNALVLSNVRKPFPHQACSVTGAGEDFAHPSHSAQQGEEHPKKRCTRYIFRYSSHCRVTELLYKLLNNWSTGWELNP
jgi:hypothetical protein